MGLTSRTLVWGLGGASLVAAAAVALWMTTELQRESPATPQPLAGVLPAGPTLIPSGAPAATPQSAPAEGSPVQGATAERATAEGATAEVTTEGESRGLAPLVPGFDVVRIGRDGAALVAGQAQAGAAVTLRVDGTVVAEVAAESDGNFVALFSLAPSDVAQVLTLEAADALGAVVMSPDTIILTPRPVEMAAPVAVAAADSPVAATVETPSAQPVEVTRLADAGAVPALVPPTMAPPTMAPPTSVPPTIAADAPVVSVEPAADGSALTAAVPVVPPALAETTATTAAAPVVPAEPTTTAAAPVAPVEQTATVAVAPLVPAEQTTTAVVAPVAAAEPTTAAAAVPVATAEPTTTAVAAPVAAEEPTTTAVAAPVAPVDSAPPVALTGVADAPSVAAPDTASPAVQLAEAPSEPAPMPSAFMVTGDGSVRILDRAPQVLDNVVVDSISYSDAGDVLIAGRAATASAGANLRIYLDNRPIAVTRADSGDWTTDLPDVDPGVYVLRVDQLNEGGGVVSRFETPFQREDPARVAAARAQSEPIAPVAPVVEAPVVEAPVVVAPVVAPSADATQVAAAITALSTEPAAESSAEPVAQPVAQRTPEPVALAPAPPAIPRVAVITVQPGHTLWAISRDRYGRGEMYVQIYNANRSQIRDPDLIYPGQVFALPQN